MGLVSNRRRHNYGGHPRLCLHFVITGSNQSTDLWYLEVRVIFVHPVSSRLCADCSRIMCTAACHGVGVGRWAAATVLRAETDQNELQFTVQAFPWNVQGFNRLQHSKIVISDRFCQYSYFLGKEIGSWCFLICHFHFFPPPSLLSSLPPLSLLSFLPLSLPPFLPFFFFWRASLPACHWKRCRHVLLGTSCIGINWASCSDCSSLISLLHMPYGHFPSLPQFTDSVSYFQGKCLHPVVPN